MVSTTNKRSYQSTCNTHKKIDLTNSSDAQREDWLHNFFHLQEVPKIEDSRCKCRQENQTAKQFYIAV